MPLSLVVFDLDGTLVDSAGDLAAAVNAMLADFGCQPLSVPEVRRMIGDGVAMLVTRALAARECRQADPAAASRIFMRHYESRATALTTAFPGVAEALRALRDEGMALAVCTNKPQRISAEILGSLGLAAYFSRVIGGDSLPFRKPDPRVLLTLLDSFDATPEASLLVGDSEVDAATARSAGVPFVLMKHGYRRGPAEEIPCIAALDDFTELPAAMRALPR
jgi:phosphoglycolate phosphatase